MQAAEEVTDPVELDEEMPSEPEDDYLDEEEPLEEQGACRKLKIFEVLLLVSLEPLSMSNWLACLCHTLRIAKLEIGYACTKSDQDFFLK